MNTDLHFNCPACRRPLSAFASEAGTPAVCAHCDRPFTVPDFRPAAAVVMPASAAVAANGCGILTGLLVTLFIIIPIFAVIGILITAVFK